MNTKNTQDIIDNIYLLGDIDIHFFGEFLSWVCMDADENYYGKSDTQILDDALKIVEYLLLNGDFIAGYMCKKNDRWEFMPYLKGYPEFETHVRQIFYDHDLWSDNLYHGTVITKVNIGKKPPLIPEEIANILCPPDSNPAGRFK
jgi:hypothetical protein